MVLFSSSVFACVAGGAMLGLYLKSVLPEKQLCAETREVIKLGMGLIGTMTALLLGMQIGSAKRDYDNADAKIKEIAAKVGFLDRVMANYGPETDEARASLRAIVGRGIEHLWPQKVGVLAPLNPADYAAESWYRRLQELNPDGPTQTAFKAEAISLANELARLRWMMFAGSRGSGLAVFLGIIVVWLGFVFTSFGLLGTPNATVIVTLLACALSVSVAIGLIAELENPFGGMIRVSGEPLLQALTLMGK